jgi:hypothetical protein
MLNEEAGMRVETGWVVKCGWEVIVHVTMWKARGQTHYEAYAVHVKMLME